MVVSRRTNQQIRRINAFSLAMMPCRARTVVTWPRAAAGERIVAFARPGKPSKIRFFGRIEPVPGRATPAKTASVFNGF
jgi:hypothetical protein